MREEHSQELEALEACVLDGAPDTTTTAGMSITDPVRGFGMIAAISFKKPQSSAKSAQDPQDGPVHTPTSENAVAAELDECD